MYLHAMGLVRIGDSSVATYELVLARIKDLIMEVSPSAETKDSLGIEDRLVAESNRKNIGSASALHNIEGEMVANEKA